jgi:hypothetical protein
MMLVMIVTFSAFVLGMGYLCSASVRLASSGNYVAAAKARGGAEAALEHAKHILNTNPESVGSITQGSPMGPFVLDGNVLYRFYFAAGSGTNDLYTPVGIGSCGGVSVTCSASVRSRNSFSQALTGLSPEAYWRLGEPSGTLVHDQAGDHNGSYRNGVALGAPPALVGDSDTSAHFDGTDDYVDVGSFDLPGTALTISAWINPDSTSLDERFVIAKKAQKNPDHFAWGLSVVCLDGRNQAMFRVRSTGGQPTTLSGGTVVPGQWTFLVGVYDGTDMILYQDGAEVARTHKSGQVWTCSNEVWIGGDPDGSASNHWRGYLDEVSLLLSPMGAAQVRSLYTARNPQITVLSWSE